MILADKIIKLRKKNGWSQEELADKMHVSRQAVSKWEAAQTTPDLEKILGLAKLFGVTTDYLLKDELESEEFSNDNSDSTCRQVTMEEANTYLRHRQWAASRIALATVLCILSPLCLILMGALSESSYVNENLAVFYGLACLFVLVAVAVAVFIYVGFQNSPYEFLDKEPFELAYGVAGMVKQRQNDFRSRYTRNNIAGTCLCILAPVPLFLSLFTTNTLIAVVFLSVMFVTVALGVICFIRVGVPWAGMERLLREGDFAPKNKPTIRSTIDSVYWPLVTAGYLLWSFISGKWEITWIVWPVAGILSAALTAILDLVAGKEA